MGQLGSVSAAPRRQEAVIGAVFKGPDQEPGRIMRWHVLGGICLLHGFRKGVELGVSQGRFTMFLCAIMHDMQMMAVDRWEEQPDHKTEGWVGWDHEGSYQRFKNSCDQYFPGRVHIHRMDSADSAALVEDGSVDFVFIDGDHSYEGCLRDIDAWLPKVRKGGLICGHDYNNKWPGVLQAVAARFEKIAVAQDSVWMHFVK